MKRKIPVIILLVLFVIVFSYNEKYQIQHVDYNMLTIVPLTETDLQINDKKIIKFSEIIVPIMSILYIIMGCVMLCANLGAQIPYWIIHKH